VLLVKLSVTSVLSLVNLLVRTNNSVSLSCVIVSHCGCDVTSVSSRYVTVTVRVVLVRVMQVVADHSHASCLL